MVDRVGAPAGYGNYPLWELLGELTQDEMNEALDALQCWDYNAPFGERYLRCDAACVVDPWLRAVEKPRLHHFQAHCDRLTDPNEFLVHSVVSHEPLRPVSGEQLGPEHQ